MAISFKGAHFPPEVILMGVRWYLAYPLSTRHVEELMEERGVNCIYAQNLRQNRFLYQNYGNPNLHFLIGVSVR